MCALQRNATRYSIFINGQFSDGWETVRVMDSAGGKRLDFAELEAHPQTFQVISALNVPLLNSEIEIVDLNRNRVVHYGKVTQSKPRLGKRGEYVQIVSRLEPYLMGGRSVGQWIWSKDLPGSGFVLTSRDILFNPVRDGRVEGNRHPLVTLPPGGVSVFLDPDSVRTTASKQEHNALNGAAFWTLSRAVHYLCWTLNPTERYVRNPPLAFLANIFNDTNDIVRGVEIKRGLWLSEALDAILDPLGYHWMINRKAIGVREFAFFKRGTDGAIVSVKHQPDGATLDTSLTNLEDMNLSWDINHLANEILVLGDYGRHELTATLHKAWPSSQDTLEDDDLAKDNANFEDNPNAYRKWVLNEAGDYIGTRSEITDRWSGTLKADLMNISVFFPAKRRKLLPTLTLNDDLEPIGNVRGIQIEMTDPLDSNSWIPIPNADVQILDKECGIYLNADRVPKEILIQGNAVEVRATFTLENDFRLTGTAAAQLTSPNNDSVPVVVKAENMFRYNKVEEVSQYSGGSNETLEQDDTSNIAAFATYVQFVWDRASLEGTLVINGLDNDYEVSQRVNGIQGRLGTFQVHGSLPAFPQIVAIERRMSEQLTVLHIESFREPLRI